MGCTQSKVEEESVTRCKERKQHMKAAVSYRNAFAAAHSGYAIALKNTGAALSDYGQGEAPDPRPTTSAPSTTTTTTTTATAASAAAAVVQPPSENILRPPPPPNDDLAPQPLQRAASMPDLPITKPNKKPPVDAAIREEEDGEDEDLDDVLDGVASATAASASPPPPPPPQPAPSPSPLPPPPPVHESKGIETTFNFIFGVDAENMPGPSLSQPEEPHYMPAPSLSQPEEPHSSISEIQDDSFKKTAAPPPAATASIDTPDPPVTLEKTVDEPPLKTTRKQKQGSSTQYQHSASAGGGSSDSKRGRIVLANSGNISLLKVLHELDEHFLKAYESAHEVSKMLEATRMHYHSNFADNRGHIDHSARVMRVITWNRSLKGIPNADDGKDDFDSDEWETHATILDKMLAWEKKLYDEVKAGELMKIEYQRKVALLNKQKKRGVNPEALEKTKSAVSHLHTRYIVDMQSMDSTVSEINRLRDNGLYPKLVELVTGMANMWETMYGHHSSQLKIVADFIYLDVSLAPKETSEQHHGRTIQLLEVLREWHSQFDKLMTNQIAYIRGLNGWLKLNLIPIESNLKEKVSSPPRVIQPPIQTLLHAWNDQVDKLPVELASGAIKRFSEVVNTIVIHQDEELKQKEKCEEMHREHLRKARAFEDWKEKYLQKRAASSAEEADPETREGVTENDPLVERQIAVETLKLRLESELEDHRRLCKQVRDKSLGSLKTHLPELFRAISDFALHSSNAYKMLRDITQSQNLEE